MKKVIFVIAPLSSGHVQKWIYPLLDDYNFIFITLHDSELMDEFKGFRKYSVPRLTKTRLDFIFSILYVQYLEVKHSPDIIYSSFLSSYGILSAFVFSKAKKYLSTWGSDVNGKPQSSFFLKLVIKRVINSFDWINAPAEHIKTKLIKLGCRADLVEVFQYGVNVDKVICKDENMLKKITENHEFPLKFISVRNWDEIYNIESVIYAYSDFCNKHKINSELTIIGKSTTEQRENIENLVDSLTFPDGKINLLGFVSSETLNGLLLSHDIVISIPSTDGAPLSLLEAMYVGLLPVVSKIDANEEWLPNSQCVYFDFKDKDGLCTSYYKAAKMYRSEKILDILSSNREKVVQLANYRLNTNRLREKFKE